MSIITAIAEGMGNAWNKISGKEAAMEKQQKFAAAEAEKQRAWEEQMSNTAFQRGSADMEKAGLNAAMMYSGGSGGGGASTPHGAAATGSAVSGGDPISGISSLINSAANLARAFNHDKNPKNDVTTKQVFDHMGKLQKTIYSENTKY